MLSKRPHPVIGRLSELLLSGNRAGFSDGVGTSPRGPLDYKIQSPRALKSYDIGGVGLGIVAALDKSGQDQVLGKYALCCPNSSRAVPIPVDSGKSCRRWAVEVELESLENYTYVICNGPNNQSYKKVYYDGFECDTTENQFQKTKTVDEEVSEYPTSDFLSCCNLCRKKLHGRDIYMYRGEKGFCSAECRTSQMMIEERKEKCRSKASESADVSSHTSIFSAGIFAI